MQYFTPGHFVHLFTNVCYICRLGYPLAARREDRRRADEKRTDDLATEEGYSKEEKRQRSSLLFGGEEFIQFLAALAVLSRTVLKNRMNSPFFLSLLVLLHNKNFMIKLKFNNFFMIERKK